MYHYIVLHRVASLGEQAARWPGSGEENAWPRLGLITATSNNKNKETHINTNYEKKVSNNTKNTNYTNANTNSLCRRMASFLCHVGASWPGGPKG